MDIISHGLWTGALATAVSRKRKKPLSALFAAFWGVLPDLFAFTIPFVWMIATATPFGRPDPEPPTPDGLFVWRLASSLYNLSHSAVVFAAVMAILYVLTRRIRWEMFGWFLHILIDIPTHSYRFFPTPFLWPVSTYKFNGFSWAEPWFMIANSIALVVAFSLLWLSHTKRRKTKTNSSPFRGEE